MGAGTCNGAPPRRNEAPPNVPPKASAHRAQFNAPEHCRFGRLNFARSDQGALRPQPVFQFGLGVVNERAGLHRQAALGGVDQ